MLAKPKYKDFVLSGEEDRVVADFIEKGLFPPSKQPPPIQPRPVPPTAPQPQIPKHDSISLLSIVVIGILGGILLVFFIIAIS